MYKLINGPAHDNNLSIGYKSVSPISAGEDITEGTLHAGEEITPGTLHWGEDIEPGILCAGEDLDPWTLHAK